MDYRNAKDIHISQSDEEYAYEHERLDSMISYVKEYYYYLKSNGKTFKTRRKYICDVESMLFDIGEEFPYISKDAIAKYFDRCRYMVVKKWRIKRKKSKWSCYCLEFIK